MITLSRFLWLEQWRGRPRCRTQPRSPWEQWILRKRAFWAGACHPRFLVRLLETVKCRNSRAWLPAMLQRRENRADFSPYGPTAKAEVYLSANGTVEAVP